jgi:hypothetical protein
MFCFQNIIWQIMYTWYVTRHIRNVVLVILFK